MSEPMTDAELDAVRRYYDRGGLPDCWVEYVGRLLATINDLKITISIADQMRADALETLEEFRQFDGDDDLWAAMKRERDEARAELARETAKVKQQHDLIRRVHEQAGNGAPEHRRHALTPGLRDEIADAVTCNGTGVVIVETERGDVD